MAIKRNGSTAKYMLLHNGEKLKKGYHNGTTEIWSAGSTVTYVLNSGVEYTEDVDNEASCLSPTTFNPDIYTDNGWTFIGWREDTTASGDILSSKIMDSDPITLYAVYRQTITVTYYNNSTTASSTYGYRYFNNGNIVNPSFTLTQATRSGWTARGWSTGTAGNSGISYNNATAFTISANTTVYGMYQQTITLTYYNNTTTKATTTGNRYYNSNGAVVNPSFTLTQATRSGWTARGWSTSTAGNGGIAYNNARAFTISANTTVYGMYQKTCTLTCISWNNTQYAYGTAYYNSNGQTVAATTTAPTGATVSGWTWRGWTHGLSGNTSATASVSFANGATVSMDTSNYTIYGLYYQTVYLYYNGNGATSGSTATQSGTRYYNAAGNYSNPTFTLSANGFGLSNYIFSKWAIGSAGGTQYSAGASVTLSASTTFYAVWIQSVYEYGYVGTYAQVFTVPVTGTYRFQVWGAQGGNSSNATGGYGGYAIGDSYFTAGRTLYVVIGGAGANVLGDYNAYSAGGFNGGGTGSGGEAGGGGGCTHIGTFNNTLAGNGSTAGLLIAAGGGGGAGAGTMYGTGNGGSGGGTSGGNADGGSNATKIGYGASQSSGGTGVATGSFGQGANVTGLYDGGGGGGGLYGGGSGGNYNGSRGGGGGSGYTGGVANSSMANGQRSGNGYAIITLVSAA